MAAFSRWRAQVPPLRMRRCQTRLGDLLRCRCQVRLDVAHLLFPALGVVEQGAFANLLWQRGETGLDDRQPSTLIDRNRSVPILPLVGPAIGDPIHWLRRFHPAVMDVPLAKVHVNGRSFDQPKLPEMLEPLRELGRGGQRLADAGAAACHDSRMTALLERLKAFLGRYLRPEDSLLEVLGGVIVVLATVNTLVVTRDRAGVDQLLEASFAVAIAWGLVDAALGLFGTVYHRKYQERTIRAVQETDEAGGLAIISGVFDDELLELADPEMRDTFYRHLAAQARAEQANRRALNRTDLIAAVLVLGLMFSATLPLSIPLSFLNDPDIAVLAMNGMGFAFLFLIGWLWADYTTLGRIKLGLALGSIALALAVVANLFD